MLVVCIFLIPFLCGSCTIQKKSHTDRAAVIIEQSTEIEDNKKVFDVREAERQEAALVDIPIPLYIQRLPIVANSQYGSQVVLGYHSNIEFDSLVNLYQDQMERQGWKLARSFTGTDTLLQFEKPTRACSVSIRRAMNKATGTDLIIYLEDNTFSW